MLRKSARALGFIPQFSKVPQVKPFGGTKNFCAVVPAESEESKEVKNEKGQIQGFDKLRFWYPEFLPDLRCSRNSVREKLERRDMLRRRKVLHIPEFYVGSILAVTTADKHVPNKEAKFVGICIQRFNYGLNSKFLLRNVIEHQGIEIMYQLYSPVIQKIEVLRLEKRLDDELLYLRDAPLEYSTFPMDMMPEYFDETKPVPVNTIKVPLNPRPWIQRYELKDFKGVILPELPEKLLKRATKAKKPWEKYDLMDEYRKVIPEEEQKDIFGEIENEIKELESKRKSERRKKVFTKPARQKLF